MEAALSYLDRRMRTEREMYEYLDKLNYGEADIEATMARLKELRYVDDRIYVEEYIRSRLATKPVSRRYLIQKLTEHGLDRELIQEGLSRLPEETEWENAYQVGEKFYRQFAALPREQRKQRFMSRLMNRGYGVDMALRIYALIETEQEGQEE